MYKLIFYSVLLFFAVPTYTASAYMAPSTAKTNIQKQCGICLDEKPKVAFVDLECGHNYCFDCLQSMVDMALKEKSSQDLKCPNPRCKKTFSHRDIFNITNSKKIVDDIAQIQMYELMATLPDAKHCPTPNCNYVFIGDDSGQPFKVTCPICHQKYCSKCLKDHDPKISCQEAAQLQQQDTATIEYLRANKIKPCPQCGIHVEKIDGCDYVTCKKCTHGFCINCYGQHHVNKCAEPEVDPYAQMLTEAPKAQVLVQPQEPKNIATVNPNGALRRRHNSVIIPPAIVQQPKQTNLPQQHHVQQNQAPKTTVADRMAIAQALQVPAQPDTSNDALLAQMLYEELNETL
ncbi:hypothetical protein KBD08_02210 [Candidatus Babeliales bacterium]|nr:hypothetical protein [Candidatus Babeliales bacterium]